MSILKITALAMAVTLPGLAVAQTAAPAPAATDTPAAAAAPAMPAATDTPAYVNLINDDSITSRLEEAGYENITVARSGSQLTIDATKEGKPTNLVYDLNTGSLTQVDGAGYTVESSAPAVTTGDAQKQGMTDQGGIDGQNPDPSGPKGGTSDADTGSSDTGSENTEPSDGGNINN